MHRYTYATLKTLPQAKAKLEDLYNEGQISEGERPEIQRIGNSYAITLIEAI